jgi:hypothetical protein
MSYEESSASKTYGHQSAHAAALALNPGGAALIGNSSGVTSLGPIKAEMPKGRVRYIVRSSAAYAAGESLAVELRWQDANGDTKTPSLGTLDSTNVTAKGEYEIANDLDVGKIAPGTVVSLSTTYTAGGTPADPNVSHVLQLY